MVGRAWWWIAGGVLGASGVAAAAGCTQNTIIEQGAPPADGGTLTQGQELEQFGAVLCDRLSACDPAAFMKVYGSNDDAGISNCVQAGKEAATAKGDSLDASASCSQNQVSQCTTDIGATSCGNINNIGDGGMPASCNGC